MCCSEVGDASGEALYLYISLSVTRRFLIRQSREKYAKKRAHAQHRPYVKVAYGTVVHRRSSSKLLLSTCVSS